MCLISPFFGKPVKSCKISYVKSFFVAKTINSTGCQHMSQGPPPWEADHRGWWDQVRERVKEGRGLSHDIPRSMTATVNPRQEESWRTEGGWRSFCKCRSADLFEEVNKVWKRICIEKDLATAWPRGTALWQLFFCSDWVHIGIKVQKVLELKDTKQRSNCSCTSPWIRPTQTSSTRMGILHCIGS